jgi:hypothetical protein
MMGHDLNGAMIPTDPNADPVTPRQAFWMFLIAGLVIIGFLAMAGPVGLGGVHGWAPPSATASLSPGILTPVVGRQQLRGG